MDSWTLDVITSGVISSSVAGPTVVPRPQQLACTYDIPESPPTPNEERFGSGRERCEAANDRGQEKGAVMRGAGGQQ